MKTNRWFVHLAGLVFLLGPCDEILPPYTEPEDFLQGEMSGLYVLGGGNHLSTYFTITNIYEETLDDTVNFQGSIKIQSIKFPHITKTISFSSSSLHSGTQYYNPLTRQLILDPEASITFRIVWDFTSDDREVDPRGELFTFYSDPECVGRCRATKEEFFVSGEVLIFDERAPVRAMMVIPVCYVYPYIGPPACSSIITDPPCVEPPQTAWARCYPF